MNDIFSEDDLNPFGSKKGKSSKKDVRRQFTKTQKNEIWDKQRGKCASCEKRLRSSTVEYDHKKSHSSGGRTTVANGQALCPECHKLKTHKSRLKKHNKSGETKSVKKKSRGTPSGLGFSERDLNPFGA